jgi:hypothetical protein
LIFHDCSSDECNASPARTVVEQLYYFGEDQYEVGSWTTQEAEDLYNEEYAEANNGMLYDEECHSDLHAAPVWNGFVSSCGLSAILVETSLSYAGPS